MVVNKSTVPVGSGDYVSMMIRDGTEEVGGGEDEGFRVVSNPEFLREGSAIYDSLFPDRIVVGTDSREALEGLRALYGPIIEQSFPTELDPRPKVAIPFVTTDLASAEMIKYAANAFLATKKIAGSTTRPSATPSRSPSPTTATAACRRGSCVSSTPTAPRCAPTTGA